jgi:LmbE family N-acetylglucosaminyl deacetylase
MELVVDEYNLGRSESEWAASGPLRKLPALDPIRARRVVVVAPHPDDEVFGTGGLLQAAHANGIPVEFVSVSDGEASHAGVAPGHVRALRATRRAETSLALRRLGWDAPSVTRLGLPDGQVRVHIESLVASLVELLRPEDLCLAPWWHDGHPDHDACGTAARIAAGSESAQLLGYLVWAWHWGDPLGSDLPWEHCHRFEFNRRMAARKRWATAAFVSQTRPRDPGAGETPVLPSLLLRRFWRQFEVFVDAEALDHEGDLK